MIELGNVMMRWVNFMTIKRCNLQFIDHLKIDRKVGILTGLIIVVIPIIELIDQGFDLAVLLS
jgi:hypothetical protein